VGSEWPALQRQGKRQEVCPFLSKFSKNKLIYSFFDQIFQQTAVLLQRCAAV
jgi:hypothetical protein